jgi:hypothetical protein
MKWVRLPGRRCAHAVSERNETATLCGLPTDGGAFLASIDEEDRCGNCDERWRREGRKSMPRPASARPATDYEPRNTFEDWDKLEGWGSWSEAQIGVVEKDGPGGERWRGFEAEGIREGRPLRFVVPELGASRLPMPKSSTIPRTWGERVPPGASRR